jgi:hypothetical protein
MSLIGMFVIAVYNIGKAKTAVVFNEKFITQASR